MLHKQVNGCDIAYVELGSGPPLVCVHGTLGDFRVWSPVMGPLSRGSRVISLSLRHFFPEHWDGIGDYTMALHVADVIAFIEALAVGPVDLMGHSRGGHVAFRVAQQRPDLLRRLVLAEPGGELDASLTAADHVASEPMASRFSGSAAKIAAGDIDGGLTIFAEGLEGPGAWDRVPATVRQTWRDNARTMLGQVDEQRQPFARSDAEAIRVPTLLVGGGETRRATTLAILDALQRHMPDARLEWISGATHFMFEDNPPQFAEVVTAFLR